MNDTQLKTLVSSVNYPITITYNGEGMVIPPRGIIKNVNPKLINGALPNGLQLI